MDQTTQAMQKVGMWYVGNESLDLFSLLFRLYGCVADDVHAFLNDCVRGLKQLGVQHPSRDGASVSWVDSESSPRRVQYELTGSTRGVTFERLVFLERVAQDVLDTVQSPDAYRAWSAMGQGTRPGQKRQPPPYSGPAWWSAMQQDDGVLASWQHLYGEVGVYWLFPMLFAMYADTLGWKSIQRQEDEPPCIQGDARHELCQGCAWEIRHWPRFAWTSQKALVDFIAKYQCQEPPVTPNRPHNPGVSPNPMCHDLYCLTVGGVPFATAGVDLQFGEDDSTHLCIETLCAATGTGGGTVLVRHLQAETIRLECAACTADVARGFFASDALGFQYLGVDASPCLVWRPSNAKEKPEEDTTKERDKRRMGDARPSSRHKRPRHCR